MSDVAAGIWIALNEEVELALAWQLMGTSVEVAPHLAVRERALCTS